jgi:chromosome segregation ATPase
MLIIVAALGVLPGGAPALAQTTQAQNELKQAREQLARDRQALEAARKSGSPAQVRAAEDKVQASRNALETRRLQTSQPRADPGRDHQEWRDARRYRYEGSEERDEPRDEGKSARAHAEKKGYDRDKGR